MLSKMFSFNRGIFKHNMHQVGWVALAYFLCLLFTLPIQILFEYSNATPTSPFLPRASLFFYSHGLIYFLTFILPLLLGIFLFRYMQVKLSSDFIHGLPIRREQLFIQQMLTGTILVIVPFFLNAAILWLIGFFIPAPELLSLSSVGEWLGLMILMNLFVFYVTVFVGMFTGISVLQAVLTYILFVFPTGIIVLLLENISYTLYGFTAGFYIHENSIPFTVLINHLYEPTKPSVIITYIVLTMLAFVSSYFLYKLRHAEAATLAISISPLKPIFKYGITFCFMLLGGLYYGSVNSDWGWIIFGYVISALFGYFIAEMIIQKTWRVFNSWKGFIGYIVVASLIAIFIYFDITGYEKRMPEFEAIEQVYFSEDGYVYTKVNEENENLQHYMYDDSEVIQSIMSLHEQLIKDKNNLMNDRHTIDQDTKRFTIAYELKNGRSIIREYAIPTKAYKALLEPILESDEYKRKQNPILNVDVNDIQSIQVNNWLLQNHQQQAPLFISEQIDIQTFYDALIKDIFDQRIDDILNEKNLYTFITVTLNNGNTLELSWNQSFTQLDEWIKERQLLSKVRLSSENVKLAIIVEDQYAYDIFETVQYTNDLNKLHIEYTEISTDEEIDELLNDLDFHYYHSSYSVLLFLEDELLHELFFINEEDVQKFLP